MFSALYLYIHFTMTDILFGHRVIGYCMPHVIFIYRLDKYLTSKYFEKLQVMKRNATQGKINRRPLKETHLHLVQVKCFTLTVGVYHGTISLNISRFHASNSLRESVTQCTILCFLQNWTSVLSSVVKSKRNSKHFSLWSE
jgi:hypothetical protein